MAVVFISPKKRQRMFFMGITAIFLLLLVIIFFGVFSPAPKTVTQITVLNKPSVAIDMSIFSSNEFKNLQPFGQINSQYSYTAKTKNNQSKSGLITAATIDQARNILSSNGLTILTLQAAQTGRSNPFAPYYQVVAQPAQQAGNTPTATSQGGNLVTVSLTGNNPTSGSNSSASSGNSPASNVNSPASSENNFVPNGNSSTSSASSASSESSASSASSTSGVNTPVSIENNFVPSGNISISQLSPAIINQ